MKYTSNDIKIILIHPVVSAGQGGAKVVDHPVYAKLCNYFKCDHFQWPKVLGSLLKEKDAQGTRKISLLPSFFPI